VPFLEAITDPERNRRSNFLLVIDFGYGPQKATGPGGTIAGFSPTPTEGGPPPPPTVQIDGQAVNLEGLDRPPVDLVVLAQEQRWQSLDTIRAVKSALGTGLMIGGLAYGTQNNSRPEIVLATMIGGMLLKASSQADTRQWEMLPRTVFVLPLHVPPGTHDVSVEFPAVPGVRQDWRGLVAPPEGQEATYYFRMQRGIPGPFYFKPPGAPPGGPDTPPAPDANR